jgi:hypothetical protein
MDLWGSCRSALCQYQGRGWRCGVIEQHAMHIDRPASQIHNNVSGDAAYVICYGEQSSSL